MTKRTSRSWTADEKLQILEEARQPNTSVAEVLRRHRVDGTTVYRWEREAKAAMREALTGKTRRRCACNPTRSSPRRVRQCSRLLGRISGTAIVALPGR